MERTTVFRMKWSRFFLSTHKNVKTRSNTSVYKQDRERKGTRKVLTGIRHQRRVGLLNHFRGIILPKSAMQNPGGNGSKVETEMEINVLTSRSCDCSLENLSTCYCCWGQKVILARIIHFAAPQLARDCHAFLVDELFSLRLNALHWWEEQTNAARVLCRLILSGVLEPSSLYRSDSYS